MRHKDSDFSMHILLRQPVPRLACSCMLSPDSDLPKGCIYLDIKLRNDGSKVSADCAA